MRSPILLSSVLLGTASTVLADPSNEQFVSYLSRQPNAHANKYTSRSDSHLQSRKTKAADYAPAFGMAAKVIGDALGLPSAQNMPTPGYGMGMGMGGMGFGMGMGRPFRRDILEDLLQRELSDEEADVLEARADEYKELVARKAADYAPAIGMAAKLIGDALGLPSAQNMPTSGYGMGMGMGMGMGGMGMGMGMGRPFRRDVLEGLLGRELSDDEADVLEARSQDEYEDLQARKAADYAPAIGMAAKLVGDALGLPSAQNMPTPGMGMGMGMGGMGMGRMFRRSFEELYERQLTDYDDLD